MIRGIAFAVLLGAVHAQALPLRPGFSATLQVQTHSAAWRQRGLAAGQFGDDVYFARGNELFHQRGANLPTSLGFTSGGSDIGFVARPANSSRLFFSEYGNGIVMAHDLATGLQTPIATVRNAFDLDLAIDGTVLLSANPGWPAAGSNSAIFAVTTGGATHRVLQLLGPSGPLLVLPSGDLLVAELGVNSPPTPGGVRILRLSAGQLANAIASRQTLTTRDATVFTNGLDGAFDLAADDRGAIYVSDPNFGDVRRIAADGSIDPFPLLARQSKSTLDLAFLDGGPAAFLPRQRDDSGTLWCALSDFTTAAEIVAVRPSPPRLDSPQAPAVPRGPARIDAAGLSPLAPAILLVSWLPQRSPWHLATLRGADLFTTLDPTLAPVITPLVVDGHGDASFLFDHRGGTSSVRITLEAWSLPTGGSEFAAISEPLVLDLLQ
ncbi:MAG: hypothetical protein AB7T19_02750 [Planctomycetota bacterium]